MKLELKDIINSLTTFIIKTLEDKWSRDNKILVPNHIQDLQIEKRKLQMKEKEIFIIKLWNSEEPVNGFVWNELIALAEKIKIPPKNINDELDEITLTGSDLTQLMNVMKQSSTENNTKRSCCR